MMWDVPVCLQRQNVGPLLSLYMYIWMYLTQNLLKTRKFYSQKFYNINVLKNSKTFG